MTGRMRIAVKLVSRLSAWCALVVNSPYAHAVTTSWNTNSSGAWTAAANWDNGVPRGTDTAVFNRGAAVTYTVSFPGHFLIDPPMNYSSDRLIVRSNTVSFADQIGPVFLADSYTVNNASLVESTAASSLARRPGTPPSSTPRWQTSPAWLPPSAMRPAPMARSTSTPATFSLNGLIRLHCSSGSWVWAR